MKITSRKNTAAKGATSNWPRKMRALRGNFIALTLSLSRNDAVAMGSARALACGVPRLAGPSETANDTNHLVRVEICLPTGEGAGWHRPGRVCSPQPTESFRLRERVGA